MRNLEISKGPARRTKILMMTSVFALMAASSAVTAPAFADEAAAKKWIDREFQPSTVSKDAQLKEMQWFIKAAEPFKGMEINAVSETLTVHEYESRTLAKAFEEITGIKVKHDIIQEGDVVEKIQTQMQSGKNVYDGWINDSDFIGTHFRYGQAVDLTDWMAKDGKDVTDPQLDVNDFIGKSFTTAPNGHLYQLPDQQFANLYWFRYDWFTNPDYKAKFKTKYGYELGVPVNWSAYEDIADFFTNDVKEINGTRIYGHMDYGKKDPSLGWRFTDAWLSMAGNGDKGIPNGLPVDEWGIRMEGCRPVGSSVERGGDVNGPAAVYSIVKYLDWMKKYAPPQAQGMTFSESGPVPSQGAIAQQIFWYTAFTREADIWDKSFTERAPKLGGLIEFYRSPARVQWTPTGNNVPDYPKLAQLWWQNIGDASSGAKTPQAAMDSLAAAQDSVMERLEKSGVQGACGPKMNKKETAEYWFAKSQKDGNIAPQRKLANEKPKGETIDYDTLIKSWPASPPKRASN